MSANPQRRPPTYRRHWCVAGLLLLASATTFILTRPDPQADAPKPLPARDTTTYVQWFQIVRMPELRGSVGDDDFLIGRLREWLAALRQAGFHLRPFGEVLTRLRQGEGVPRDTVVLVFDPAYRVTVDHLLPLLRETRTPALWITRAPGSLRPDRRFLASHTRHSLARSPLWDIGLTDDSTTFTFEAGAPETFVWHADSGVRGYNPADRLDQLSRLHANPSWTPQELVDRLLADQPLERPSQLTVRRIQRRPWGIVLPEQYEESFDLTALPDRRFASVYWTGTRGILDLDLSLSVDSWFGEVWCFLRSNRETEERIRVGLFEGKVRVLQEWRGDILSDVSAPAPILPSEGVRLSLHLEGDRLVLASPDQATWLTTPVQVRGSPDSLTEFALYHRIRGAALARGVRLTAHPLTPSHNSPSTREFFSRSSAPSEADLSYSRPL